MSVKESENISPFVVNEYITLKLENKKTNIYIKGRYYGHCKYLLMNIPTEDLVKVNEYSSIDQASENLDGTLETGKTSDHGIQPGVEFWGHCSNLQAWAEHNYNTNLLHRNLAFSLLKKLQSVGDPIAKKVFKEEIAKRFAVGYENVMNYLLACDYLEYLSAEEMESVLEEMDFSHIDYPNFIKNAIKNILKSTHAKTILKKMQHDALETKIYIPFDEFFLENASEEGFEVSSDGKKIYYGTENNELFYYTLSGGYAHYLHTFKDKVDEIGISQDGTLLGLGFYNGGIAVWDTNQKKVIFQCETPHASARCLKFSGDNTYLLASLVDGDIAYSALFIWDLKSGKLFDKLTSFHDLVPFDVSPEGKNVVFATKTGDVVLMDIASKTIYKTLSTKTDFTRIYFSPNGQNIIASVGHKTIRVWDIPKRNCRSV